MVVVFVCKKGTSTKTGKGRTWTNPYDPANPSGPKRTQNMLVDDGKKAFREQNVVNGIKRPTFLTGTGCDVVHGTAVDYMHILYYLELCVNECTYGLTVLVQSSYFPFQNM